ACLACRSSIRAWGSPTAREVAGVGSGSKTPVAPAPQSRFRRTNRRPMFRPGGPALDVRPPPTVPARISMTNILSSEESALPAAVFSEQDGTWLPSALSSGPWDPRAQHGGAPSALFAHLAENALADPGWRLARL